MRKILLCSILLVSTSFSAIAATIPDAGQLLREQQPQRQLPQQTPLPKVEKDLVAPADSGVRITVKGFRFTGYEGLVAESDLQAAVAAFAGKDLTFSELQGVASTVTNYLKEKGWFLARAYLPKQDISSGIIEIAVIQGKSDGGITITRDASARISDAAVRARAERATAPNQPLNEQALERAVLLINDLPGVTAKASLAPGATSGSTAVHVDISEGPLLSGSLWGDNQGNRYTGAWRGNGMLNINDPFRYGDQISLLVTGAEGLIQGRAGYTFPIAANSNGLKGTVSYTGMHYNLIGDLASLNTEGLSHTIDVGLSYPLLRSRITNVNAAVGYEYKKLTDTTSGIDIRGRQLHSGTGTVSGDQYDTLLGGGYSTANIAFTAGSMHESIADIAITKTEGGYGRFNFGLSRLQRLVDRTNLAISYSGQISVTNLDSSEKFSLGGPNGIRAYPIGEASGDSGHLFNIDLRYDLPIPALFGSLQLVGFYDAGHITLHNTLWDNAVSTATNSNDYWLQGAGVGFTYSYKSRFSLKTSWAHTLGDNPGRSTTGSDADGRSDQNRFWLQGSFIF